ncbi:alpha/beta hydrolase [Acuticoccus kandeliae]|uniref:alpha/beta hydrolase n=1 Tax=Acuticoccus kandeliae TaxID=2073160 RepID=UPI0013005663|nr:alpha/beta hydrolase-fold protein [Acuticoccus kandeliae]
MLGVVAGLFLAHGADAGDLRLNSQIDSDALGRPFLYNIYLPDGHDAPDAAFPVVYLLHGFGGGRHEWAEGGRLAEQLDRMIAAGEIAPVIAVMPEAGKSWYVDSARFGGEGDYETAIVADLVPAIDRAYPTRKTAAGRAIAGNSMGGHGALRLAFRHPDMFGAVAALSPGVWRPDALSWATGPAADPPQEREKWFPRTTGTTFDMEVFKAQSPFASVAAVGALEAPPRILLAVGDDDYWQLHDGTVDMYIALREVGLKPELRVSDGAHDWNYWRPMVPVVFHFFDAGFAP